MYALSKLSKYQRTEIEIRNSGAKLGVLAKRDGTSLAKSTSHLAEVGELMVI